MLRPNDLPSDSLDPDDFDDDFVFDFDSNEPLELGPLEAGEAEPLETETPFVAEDPELEWVTRWRAKQADRKRR